jgi:hypothetical protein
MSNKTYKAERDVNSPELLGGGPLTASMVLAREAHIGHRDVEMRRMYNAFASPNI